MRLTYFYILKTILILNLLFCSLSFADNHDINKTLELIQKILRHLKKQFTQDLQN